MIFQNGKGEYMKKRRLLRGALLLGALTAGGAYAFNEYEKRKGTGEAEEIAVPVDFSYMNVTRFGRGPRDLVIVAGLSLTGLEGQGKSIAEAYQVFAKDYTVYLFDRKNTLSEGYTIHDMAEDVRKALDYFKVKRADFYGVSQGGMICLDLALEHPDLVRKLVLCSSAARITDEMKEKLSGWLKKAEEGNVVELNRSFFDLVYSDAFKEAHKDMLPVLEQLGTKKDCEKFVIQMKSIENFDVFDRLDQLKAPLYVIGDKDDKVLGIAPTCEIAARTGCEFYLYEGYSHAVYDEAPDIKERIYNFLRK